MWQGILYFISKIILGVVVAAWGYEKSKKKKYMRQIDNLAPACQGAILYDMVALAKAYEAVHNTGDTFEELACDFGQTYMLTLADFGGINISNVVSWVGPIPPKPPRII